MQKRLISFICALVMILGLLPAGPQAAAAGTPTVSVQNTWSTSGETVSVNITIANNPGIMGGTFTVSWADGLELTAAKNKEAFSELNYQKPSKFTPSGTNFIWYGDSATDPVDGAILTLTFKVAEGIENNKDLAVNVTAKQVIDANMETIQVNCVSGQVRVTNYMPGDVNGNWGVDLFDVISLVQYISDDCTTRPDGFNVTLNETAADVDDTATLDIMDVILIAQYISDDCQTNPDGFNVTLKPSTPRCPHVNMTQVPAKAATCTADGNILYYICNDCGNFFSDGIATRELTFEETVLVSPGHNVVIDPAVPPSHTETGLTEGSHCSICGEVFQEQEEVPVLSANYHSITYRNLNGAESPKIIQYAEHTGLDELPTPEVPGYNFLGWYSASSGGTVVDFIPAGSTQDYILYARWELVTYKIHYFEAPNYEGETSYTVEDEIYLPEPNWPGLGFTSWTEENGKLTTERKDGKTLYKIAPGTTGDLKLTANWKLMRNIATPGTNRTMLAEYDAASGKYTFIYELGTIENVVLEQMSSNLLYQHTGAGDFTLEMGSENTLEESIADSITRTISKSVASSSEWESSKDWAQENSNEHNVNASIGLTIGGDSYGYAASIEAGYGYTHSSTSSWGGSESKGGSYGTETENGEEVGSSFSYLTSLTTSSMTSVTISADAPHGYYDYVQAGNIRVFGVVTYVPNAEDPTQVGNIYLNTYSMLDNMHGVVLYYPTVNDLNNPTCETLQYNIPRENIQEKLENSYFIQYNANGGEGSMYDTLHTNGGTEKLAKNAFTRTGYGFTGWETREKVEGQDEPVSTGTYTDEQVINTALAANGVKVTMYALWTPNKYTIEYEGNKPTLGTTYVDYLPSPTACVYDQDVTLADAPTLPGYTFGGWYYDSTCTQKAGDAGETLPMANLASEEGAVVKLYAKWTANTYKLILNANGGTVQQTEFDVVFDSPIPELETPVQDGFAFLEWVLPNGATLTTPTNWTYAEDVTITAKWLKTKEVLEFRIGYKAANKRDDSDNLVTDTDKVYEQILPGMDKEALIKKGYTKLSIKVHMWLYEKHDGDKTIWLKPYYDHTNDDKRTALVSFTSTKGKWNEHTFSFDLQNLNSDLFNDACMFYIEYGAHGNAGDDWYLGDTWITIEAVK